jgi:hypothetical protein
MLFYLSGYTISWGGSVVMGFGMKSDIPPTYFILTKQKNDQTNKILPLSIRERGIPFYRSSIILNNLPIRHRPCKLRVMSDLFNIMGFLFPVPDP